MALKTSISNDTESYRKGVVFGLTMAEVLLLLVFSILLFLQLTNDKLKERDERVKLLETEQTRLASELAFQEAEKMRFATALSVQRALSSISPEEESQSELISEVVAAAIQLESSQAEKAKSLLQELKNNPKFLEQIQLSTVDEWAELSSKAQTSIPESEFAALAELTNEQRETLFTGMFQQLSEPAEEEISNPLKNDWPPIISLSEAGNFSFNTGSAILAPEFKQALNGDISGQILSILEDYEADVIEVIGHTDLQPMGDARMTNLDDNAFSFLRSGNNVALNAKDNAGLGYARALRVTRELMAQPELQGYTILPYSAAQMITPDERLQTGVAQFDSEQLRRIEIRVRRKQ